MQVINEALDTRAAIERATVFTETKRISGRDVATFTGVTKDAVIEAARKWSRDRYGASGGKLLETPTGFSLTVTDCGCD